MAALTDRDDRVRVRASAALVRVGVSGRLPLEPLVAALKRYHPQVQANVARALSHLGRDAIPALTA
ncbi:MAG: HEAT repeat domain-containing protein, partial [Gemmatimonadetes bacterium]|nr:HEAT repeat domain-containing protein [Gemmatimonadota bacterium]